MSLLSTLQLGVSAIVTFALLLVAVLIESFGMDVGYFYYWYSAICVLVLVLINVLVRWQARSLSQTLNGIETGLLNFKDNDFSVSLPIDVKSESGQLGRIAQAYNQVGEILRQERQSIYQRELLLDKVIQTSPLSMVLTDDNHKVLYSNVAARHMFFAGRRFEGLDFYHLIEQSPQSLQQAIKAGKDALCSLEIEGDEQTYHISQSQFLLNARHHKLFLFKQLTRELNRQEVEIWKKVIRVISHELNNSLAPMSSMAHSGKLLVGEDKKLNLIFDTIEERVEHLNGFIQGYAKFSKLPMPQRKLVEWQAFCDKLQQHCEFVIGDRLPKEAVSIDPAQMEQVLINLIKNAAEAGSPTDQIILTVTKQAQSFVIMVCDRGSGMSDKVLQSALLPFYSTKQTGTGLGLSLCREIVEAHEGKIAINNREGGGLRVTIWLRL